MRVVRAVGRPKRLDLETEHCCVPLHGSAKVGHVGANVVKTRVHAFIMPQAADDLVRRCLRMVSAGMSLGGGSGIRGVSVPPVSFTVDPGAALIVVGSK